MSSLAAYFVEDMAAFRHDPLGFVLYAFPWGVKGTDLERFPEGPEEWQRAQLERIGDQLRAGGDAGAVILEAIASGHGIGKSTEVAWLVLWAMYTFEDTRGVVTANTDSQLRTKTWPEIAKWHRLCIIKGWFTLAATALYSTQPDHERNWRIDIIPWSLENTEAFAGLHNRGKRIVIIFDEASSIPDPIWEVTDGATTDGETEIIWAVFGNPTRNTGRFVECWGKYRHRWPHNAVDSRSVRITNKAKIQEWIDDEGEDSDFVRVRVRGVPPRSSMMEFIGPEDWDRCRDYKAEGYSSFPILLGMDCARFGDDYNAIYAKQGRKVWFVRKWRGLDTQKSASHLVEAFSEQEATLAFVDGGGVGGGIIDRARVLTGQGKIIEVGFGERANDPTRYANKRAEMWGELRDAMRAGLELPAEDELRTDLLGPLYSFTEKQQIILEKKSEMKKRGLASPDHGDAVAILFAQKVIREPVKRTLNIPQSTGGFQWA